MEWFLSIIVFKPVYSKIIAVVMDWPLEEVPALMVSKISPKNAPRLA